MNSLKEKNIMVTGGAGFIGSHLVRKLLDSEARVTVLTRPDTDLWRIKDIINKVDILSTNFQDLKELESMIDNFEPEIIFNLMSNIDMTKKFENIEPMIKNNFLNTFYLIKVLKNKKYFKSFINIGTCGEYSGKSVPFLESNREAPISPYLLSKVFSTHLSSYLGKMENFPIITLRPFLTYGPRQINGQFIPFLISNLIEGKKVKVTKMEQTKEFVYVDDVIEALIMVPFKEIPYGEIINIGPGKETKIREVAEIICESIGRDFNEYIEMSLPHREGEAMHFYGSNEKAKNLLGWEPKISVEDGLRKTVEWYKDYLKNENK